AMIPQQSAGRTALRWTISDLDPDRAVSVSVRWSPANARNFSLHLPKEEISMMRTILLCSAAAIVIAAAAIAPALAGGGVVLPVTYTVTALPNPLGGTYAQGTSINNRRQIQGMATLPGDTIMHAILWQERQNPVDMGTLGGPNSAVA